MKIVLEITIQFEYVVLSNVFLFCFIDPIMLRKPLRNLGLSQVYIQLVTNVPFLFNSKTNFNVTFHRYLMW